MWHYKRHALFWGFLLIFVGLLLYADKVTDLDLGDILADYWPVIIILVGVYIILMNIGVSKRQTRQAVWNFGDKTIATDRDKILQSNVFGDVKITIENKDFQGGSIKTVFGDVKVDLSHVQIQSGEKTLYLTTTFGDIRVIVPQNLAIAVRAASTFGDMNILGHKRGGIGQSVVHKTDGYDEAKIKLAVITSQVFGDVKVW